MSAFTLRVEEVIEELFGTTMDPDDFQLTYEEVTFNGVKYGRIPVIPDYGPMGLKYYPIFDENYRKILNGKIINTYYYQEIGQETIEMWAQRFAAKMDEIMPYFNQLYESTLIEYAALDTMRIHSVGSNHVEGTESVNASNVTDTTTESGARVIGSNFPQTMLAANADYASNGTDTNSKSEIDSTVTQESSSDSNTDANSDNLVTGYQGAASDLITKFRNSIINIDTMILSEIEDMFMLVLNTGDEYFAYGSYWR